MRGRSPLRKVDIVHLVSGDTDLSKVKAERHFRDAVNGAGVKFH